MDLTRRLLEEPQIILSDIRQGENFEFTYRGYGRDKFLLQVFNRNQFVGVCQIKNGMANLPFDKEYRLDNEHKAALCVSRDIKTRYRGIGTTLLSFAMEICKLNGRDEFNVVANTKSYNFYEKHGFKTLYTEDNKGNINSNFPVRWHFAYDLKSELPKKEIMFKH